MSTHMTPKLLLIDEQGEIFHMPEDVTKFTGLSSGDNFFSSVKLLHGSIDGLMKKLQTGRPIQKLAACGDYTILFNITKTDLANGIYTITIESSSPAKEDDSEFINLILKNSTIYNPQPNANITIFARLSHELKTPLNAISSAVQINQKIQYPYEKQQQYFDIMLRNCRQLTRVIGNIVDFAKIEEGQGVLFYQNCDICRLIREVCGRCSPTLEFSKVQLEIEQPDEGIAAVVDGEKIVHVICNLLTNAVKCSKENNIITITASTDGKSFTVSVRDQGIGIPKHEQKRIFAKFAQVDNTKSRRYEGSGMGLALCMSIVKLHKGKIWVESEEGKGSEFFFKIPLRPADKDIIEHPNVSYNDTMNIDFDTIVNNELASLTE